MKNTLCIILSLFGGINFYLDAQTYVKPEAKWQFYLQLSAKYCPEANTILKKLPDWKEYVEYARNAKTDRELVAQFNTVVHEACHGYNYLLSQKEGVSDAYYISPNLVSYTSGSPIFNSVEINTMVSKNTRAKIFRYETYVGDGSDLSSQENGFYGLIDEFGAYYQGCLASYQIIPWYEKKYGYTNPEPWLRDFVPSLASTTCAYYEFRLFLGWYLQLAKSKHPKVYAGLQNNQDIRMAYSEFNARFLRLVLDYKKELYHLVEVFNSKGLKTELETEFIRFHRKNTSYGFGHFLDQMTFLESLLTDDMKALLQEFEIEKS